jgi:hypothetical protein
MVVSKGSFNFYYCLFIKESNVVCGKHVGSFLCQQENGKKDFGKLIGWKLCNWVLKMATHKSIKVENSRNYTRNLEFAQVVVF